jgi:DNA-directed RNA polymerase beta' subunit
MFSPESFRELDFIQFGLLSADEIIRQSACEITHLKLTGPHSVYDERLGTLDPNKKCVTCQQNSKNCVGHFGHIVLNTYILHPLFHKLSLSLLKCLCYKCSRILLTKEQLDLAGFLRFQKQVRFMKIMERMDRVDYCAHCETIQPRFVFSSQDRFIYMIFKVDGENSRIQMTENEVYHIFDNVQTSDIQMLGFDPQHFHPRSLVLTVLPVLPPVARPFIIAENITCDDDLTIQYLDIVKINHHIGEIPPHDTKRQKYIHTLRFKIRSLFDNSGDRQRVSNGRPLKGIKKRLTGKEGIIRNNLMGKRVDKSARTVIGPDPTLCIDEIAIPQEIADTLCYNVVVNRYNIDSLYTLIQQNGVNFVLRDQGNIRINMKYATVRQGTRLCFGDMVLKKKTKKWKCVQSERDLFCLEEGDQIFRHGEKIPNIQYNSQKPFELQYGDIVERKLQDGDILLLNRQPTLHRGSMIAQKVRIRPGKTIRLNLAITSSFNADFDGDEMNLHCPASAETEAELRLLSSVRQNLISAQSSKANIIIVQDVLLGAYRMTLKKYSQLTREQFYQMASILSDNRLRYLEKKVAMYRKRLSLSSDYFDGRMLFSLLLPSYFFYHHKNDADPLEPEVVIENGLLLRGAIKKTNLGSSHTSIVTTLYQEYGEDVCVDFLNDVQFLVNQFLLSKGFTVSISDCLVTKKDEIQNTISRSFMKAKSIEEHTKDERIRELYVTFALSGARDTGMAIAKNALAPDNHFLSTVISGAKGDYFNIAQITGLLGQQNLNGQRILPVLSNQKRTLPHYPLDPQQYTDDMKYESTGFIRSSFVHGLSPREFYFHAMTGREGITDTAMKTATSGYIQRRMIKIAEDIQVKYDGTVRNANNSVIQFAYGENFMDPVNTTFRGGQPLPCDILSIAERVNAELSQHMT